MVIVGALGIGFLMMIVALAWRDKQITDKGGEVLVALIAVFGAALGYYMGSRNNH